MNVNLVYFRPDGERKDIPLHASEVMIGRGEDCNLRIPLAAVSRQHCRIIITDDEAIIEDLGSSNGTLVNSTRIKRHVLKPGDRLNVGQAAFVVQIDGKPKKVRPPHEMVGVGEGESVTSTEMLASQGQRATQSHPQPTRRPGVAPVEASAEEVAALGNVLDESGSDAREPVKTEPAEVMDFAEDAVAEDAVAEDAVAEDAVAEDAVAEDAVAEDAVAEDVVPAEAAEQEAAEQEPIVNPEGVESLELAESVDLVEPAPELASEGEPPSLEVAPDSVVPESPDYVAEVAEAGEDVVATDAGNAEVADAEPAPAEDGDVVLEDEVVDAAEAVEDLPVDLGAVESGNDGAGSSSVEDILLELEAAEEEEVKKKR